MKTQTLFTLALVALLGLAMTVPASAGGDSMTLVTASEARAAISNAKAAGNETVTITPKDFCEVEATLSKDFRVQPLELNLRNGWTRASFDMPESGTLSVVLYDRLGRKVTEIENGDLDAGRHTYVFRDHRLPIETFYLSVDYERDGKTINRKLFL